MGWVSPRLSLLLLQCIYPTLVLSTPKPALNSLASWWVKEEKTGVVGCEIGVKSGAAVRKHGHGYVKDEYANTKYPQALNHESLAVMLPRARIALQGQDCSAGQGLPSAKGFFVKDAFSLHGF